MTNADVLQTIILPALQTAINVLPGIAIPDAKDELVLFGADGIFDSLNLVSFVFILEDMVKSTMGIVIKITADDIVGHPLNPFQKVDRLAAFLLIKIENEKVVVDGR
jgi:hypothetical protein